MEALHERMGLVYSEARAAPGKSGLHVRGEGGARTFTFHVHALKMSTHSSVLAWRIPGTGEPGGLLSMGSQ